MRPSQHILVDVCNFSGVMCSPFSVVLAASRIRGMVASVPFEQFHKFSSDIIHAAVFGKDSEGKVRTELLFSANNLVSGEKSDPFSKRGEKKKRESFVCVFEKSTSVAYVHLCVCTCIEGE